jgi:CheY-like chemotaxis protein
MPSSATNGEIKTPILVVDDDPDLLRLLSLRLSAATR